MRVPASLSLADDIIKGIKTSGARGVRVSVTTSGAVITDQARITPSRGKSFGTQLSAAQMPRDKGKNNKRNDDTTEPASDAARSNNADVSVNGVIADITPQPARSSASDNTAAPRPLTSSGGNAESENTSAVAHLFSGTTFTDALAMTGMFFGASFQFPSSATSATLSGSTAAIMSGTSSTSVVAPPPAFPPLSGQVSVHAQETTVSGGIAVPSPDMPFTFGSVSSVSTSTGTSQQPVSAQGSSMPTASVATLLVPNGASITNISLVTNKTVSQNQASQPDWTSLHDEADQVPAMPASSVVPTTTRTVPAPPAPVSAAAQSILARVGTNPSREADHFTISAPLASTSQAAIPVAGAVVLNATGNAVPEDSTTSTDNKQVQARSQSTTIVAGGTNTLDGLSALRSLMTTDASSTDAKAYQALTQDISTVLQPAGQPEVLSAPDIQNVDLANSLSGRAAEASSSSAVNQPATPATLTLTSAAAISLPASTVLKTAENAAPEDDTSSPDNKQAQAGSRGKTIVTEGTNTLYGLSAFQSLVATVASSTDAKAYQALAQDSNAATQPFGQPEGLSAASIQNTDPTTAIPTKATEASLSTEADRPGISASPMPTPQAAIPVAGAVATNSTGNAATGDDTSPPGDERSEAKNQDKTTITAVANAIHGLSEFQSYLTTRASSSSAEIHHALSDGNATPSPAFSRPESPSADAQNATLPNTLSMTVQTEDNTPVRLIFEGEGGLATRVILQSDDDLTTQHLAGNRKELLAALSTAGVDTSAMRLDIVTAPANTSDSHQDSLQQNNAGRSDLAGNFMGSNPQQNQQGSSSNARFWPQEPATETIEQRTAISHSQAETLAPAGGVNITA